MTFLVLLRLVGFSQRGEDFCFCQRVIPLNHQLAEALTYKRFGRNRDTDDLTQDRVICKIAGPTYPL